MAQIVTITNPLTGQPAQVDQLDHTAQQIDDAIARALPGGAIDTALANKLGGIESTAYPGCYYRTVDGVVEWFNPPMALGIEYRTTERYQGKPVYTKLLSGVMLDQNKRLNIPHGISNLQCIFDAQGNLDNAVIPSYAPVSDYTATAYGVHVGTGTASVFVASTGYSYAGQTVYVQIKYIKTTD